MITDINRKLVVTRPLPEFRWFTDATHKPAVLQQRFYCETHKDGEDLAVDYVWHDVPTVYGSK